MRDVYAELQSEQRAPVATTARADEFASVDTTCRPQERRTWCRLPSQAAQEYGVQPNRGRRFLVAPASQADTHSGKSQMRGLWSCSRSGLREADGGSEATWKQETAADRSGLARRARSGRFLSTHRTRRRRCWKGCGSARLRITWTDRGRPRFQRGSASGRLAPRGVPHAMFGPSTRCEVGWRNRSIRSFFSVDDRPEVSFLPAKAA